MKYFYRYIIFSVIILILLVDYNETALPLLGVILRSAATRLASMKMSSGLVRSTSRFVTRGFTRRAFSSRMLSQSQLSSSRILSRFRSMNKALKASKLESRISGVNKLINSKIRKKFVKPILSKKKAGIFEKIGGKYGALRDYVSSNHFPPTSLSKHSPKISSLSHIPQRVISLTKRLHQETLSWGSRVKSLNFRKLQQNLIKMKKWKNALENSIEAFQELAGHDLNPAIRRTLNFLEEIGSINSSDLKSLVKKFELTHSNKPNYDLVEFNNGDRIMNRFPASKQSAVSIPVSDYSNKNHLKNHKQFDEELINTLIN